MKKKYNNIKPGTICTLTHNKSVVFRITHVNDRGMPFAKHSYYHYEYTTGGYEFQIDDKPVCMAYTIEYEEASNEQKKIFIEMEKKETNINAFKKALREGKVEFKYTKKNGEERKAIGTLNAQVMGEENSPKGTGYEITDTNIRYYDLNSEGWRSFVVDNLIEWKSI